MLLAAEPISHGRLSGWADARAQEAGADSAGPLDEEADLVRLWQRPATKGDTSRGTL